MSIARDGSEGVRLLSKTAVVELDPVSVSKVHESQGEIPVPAVNGRWVRIYIK